MAALTTACFARHQRGFALTRVYRTATDSLELVPARASTLRMSFGGVRMGMLSVKAEETG